MNLKRHVRAVLAEAAFSSGYFQRRLRRHSDRCVAIMYHALTDHSRGPAQSPLERARASRLFEAEMQFVSRAMRPIPLGTLTECLARRDPLPANAVVVTFDDGYEDNYSIAFPILRRLGIPATIFLVTGHLDSRRPFWWDHLDALIQRSSQATIDLRGVGAPHGWPDTLPLESRRVATARMLAAWLRNLHPDAAASLMPRIASRLDGDGPVETPALLTWDQVREMHAGGIEFGAHTENHPNLGKLDPRAAEAEIRSSVQRIEDVLNARVKSFAYPYGMTENISPSLRDILKRNGVQAACTAIPGVPSSTADRYAIPRVSWSGGSVALSAWKLNKHVG